MIRLVAIFLALGLGSVAAQTTAPAAGTPPMPDGAGKPIVQRACTACHALTVVTSKHASQKEWDQVVNQMVSRGADLTDDEVDTVIEYLAKNYGPLDQETKPTTEAAVSSSATLPSPAADTQPVNVNKASAQELESSLGLAKDEAAAVVKYREQNGDFKTWHDVAAVPGVSASKIDEVQKRITF